MGWHHPWFKHDTGWAHTQYETVGEREYRFWICARRKNDCHGSNDEKSTNASLAMNDFERRCIREFAFPQRFSLTALAMRLCGLLNDWMTLRQWMVAQVPVWRGSAHNGFASSFICFLSFAGFTIGFCHKALVEGQRAFALWSYCLGSITIRLITNRPLLGCKLTVFFVLAYHRPSLFSRHDIYQQFTYVNHTGWA